MHLAQPYGQNHDNICQQYLEDRHIHRYGIHQREGDNNEEISHLAHWHSIGTIAHDGEDSEETDTHTHRGLALHILQHEDHEEDDKEDGNRYKHEREIEITPMALAEIQTVDDNPGSQHIDEQA